MTAIETATDQEPERVRSGAIWLVGGGVLAASLALIAIAWWLVVPPPAPARAAAPSPLHRELFEQAGAAAAAYAAGLQRLERTEWIDRRARVVRIPIERAIDAVVADPALIDAPAAAGERVGELGR
jgi:hypothetical protein